MMETGSSLIWIVTLHEVETSMSKQKRDSEEPRNFDILLGDIKWN